VEVEFRPGNSNNGHRAGSHTHASTDDAGIAAKPGAPEAITQNGAQRLAWPVILFVEKPPGKGFRAGHAENCR